MNKQISVSFPTDHNGFLSQECPACRRRFKVKFGSGSKKPISYCPYCGQVGEGCWWTRQQAEFLTTTAARKVVGPMLDDMSRRINRRAPSHALFGIKMTVCHAPEPAVPHEPEESWPVVDFECCGEQVRLEGGCPDVHCIICGQTTIARVLDF